MEKIKIKVLMNLTRQRELQLREDLEKALALEGLSADINFARLSKEEAEKRELKKAYSGAFS